MVLFFAGSVVVLAARELRSRHKDLKEYSQGDARHLIQALHGEILSGDKSMYVNPDAVPQRRTGQVLLPEDRKKLHQLLGSLVPSESEE